jgi:hypothetical protein
MTTARRAGSASPASRSTLAELAVHWRAVLTSLGDLVSSAYRAVMSCGKSGVHRVVSMRSAQCSPQLRMYCAGWSAELSCT